MAKLPIYQQRYPAQTRNASAEDFGGAEARALGRLGSSIGSFAQVMANAELAERKRQKDSMLIEAQGQINNTVSELSRDVNWQSHPERYEQKIKEIRDQAQGQFGDDTLYGVWEREFRRMELAGSAKVQFNAIKKQKDLTDAQDNIDLRKLATMAAQAGDQTEKDIFVQKGMEILQTRYDSGLLSAVDYDKKIQNFVEEVAGADVREIIRNDPYQAVLRLQDHKDPLAKDMEAETREVWIDRALRAYEQDLRAQDLEEKRLQRRADRAEKRLQEQIAREAQDLMNEDELTIQYLDQNRDFMSPADYRYYSNAVAGEIEMDLKHEVYVDLSTRASRGEDVRPMADNYLLLGHIDKSWRDQIHNLYKQQAGKPASVLGASKSYIMNSFGPDEMLKGMPSRVRRRAEAIREWDQWSIQNPEASAKQADDKAAELLDRWLVRPAASDYFSLPRLMYANPGPTGPDSDFNAIAGETLRAYERGDITLKQFNEQSDLIKQYISERDRMKTQ